MGASDTRKLQTGGGQDPAESPDQQKKLLSSMRLKVMLSVFAGLLVVGMSLLTFGLVSSIFDRLTPAIKEDLSWKAQRGAIELAQSIDLALAVGEFGAVEKLFAEFMQTSDVMGVVALDTQGKVVVSVGELPDDPTKYFTPPARRAQRRHSYFVAWAPAAIEGNEVGRVALVVSAARLADGERVRRQMLLVDALGCLLALGGSLLFVHLYFVPLIGLTNSALRVRGEMDIARRIQTSILPRELKIPGAKFAAVMVPATEVGGDYYDVMPTANGAWIGVGDVAGHGVSAGLVMLMVQSTVSALVRDRPTSTPSEVVRVLNAVLVENIRKRIGSDEHVTFTLLRMADDGVVTYAGAHEEIIICRAATGQCERVETNGAWLGAVPNLGRTLCDESFRLEKGDLMVLYTDGVTEIEAANGERFGVERLCAEIEANRTGSVEEIQKALVSAVGAFGVIQHDDVTILALRFEGQEI